jgi:hypothetical protein
VGSLNLRVPGEAEFEGFVGRPNSRTDLGLSLDLAVAARNSKILTFLEKIGLT